MKDPVIRHPEIFKMHKFMFLAAKSMDKVLEAKLHIGFSQCMILMYVHKHPGVSQRDISHDREITPAAVSRHVETLVEKEYLRQGENQKNKREHILIVSPKGEHLLEKIMTLMDAEIENLFSGVSKEEIHTIDSVFSKLLSSFDSHRSEC